MACGFNGEVWEYRFLKSGGSKEWHITDQSLSALNPAEEFGV